MTSQHLALAIVAAIAVVLVVYVLRNKNFSLKGNRKGLSVDNRQPETRPGIEVDGAVSRQGSVTVENNQGDGVKAKGLDAAGDVRVTNQTPPKS